MTKQAIGNLIKISLPLNTGIKGIFAMFLPLRFFNDL